MSKLSTSDPEGMRIIERNSRIEKEHWHTCTRCKGTGILLTPFSGSDPCCGDCDGLGAVE